MKCAPVMTPDELCETDVDGEVTVLTMCWIVDELVVVFGRLVRIICALSLTSLTIIVVATCRDCPRDRCGGNTVFGSFDATLNVFLFLFSIDCLIGRAQIINLVDGRSSIGFLCAVRFVNCHNVNDSQSIAVLNTNLNDSWGVVTQRNAIKKFYSHDFSSHKSFRLNNLRR